MYFKLLFVLIVSVFSVHGSGYFPSIGGPWNRYTTTTPTPGVDRPVVTEAPPPPSVTFVPRPRPQGPRQPNQNQNVNDDTQEGQNLNNNPLNIQDYFIVADPMSGERFIISKQTFWNRLGNNRGGDNNSVNDNKEQDQTFISTQDQGNDTDGDGYNREASLSQEEDYPTPRRARRSLIVSNSENIKYMEPDYNDDDSQELRQIEMLDDEYDDQDDGVDNIVLLGSNKNSEESAYQGIDLGPKSTSELFKMFFPTKNLQEPNKKMIFTYAFYRIYPIGDEGEKPTTTTTTTPTSTTEAEINQEISVETTTIPNEETTTEIPESTTTIITEKEEVTVKPS